MMAPGSAVFDLLQQLFALPVGQKVAVNLLPILLAITLQEASHGFVARHFGDDTAERLGRITLNPLRHIDPIGTVVFPIASLLLGGFLFGWAKPVPVDYSRLRRPKQDMLWVSAAGPASNLAMAVAWAALIRFLQPWAGEHGAFDMFLLMGAAGIWLNLVFLFLNLLPIPPFPGGRMVLSLLPLRLAHSYSRVEPYGMIILIVLLFSGALGFILKPFVVIGTGLIALLFGL